MDGGAGIECAVGDDGFGVGGVGLGVAFGGVGGFGCGVAVGVVERGWWGGWFAGGG